MVNTFARVFPPIFFGLFFGIFFWLVLLPRIRECKEKRARNRNQSNDTELTVISGSANINRISAADFPSHPVLLRDYHRRPSAARLARRSERLSREAENPFTDPRYHTSSFETLPTTPRNRSIPNFSTPTRQGRHSSPRHDATSTMRTAPSVVFTEHSDPFDLGPDHNMRSSPSFTDYSDRAVSIVSFPDPSYQPAKMSLPDLAKCEPRSAGQAPPLGKKLDEFPLPTSGSAHLHPNAIFTRLATETPPTPPATVTKRKFTDTGAKNPVSQIRQLFDIEKAATMPSLHAAKPSIQASSIYSCDDQGKPWVRRASDIEDEEEADATVASTPCFSRPLPPKPAPGGAEWL